MNKICLSQNNFDKLLELALNNCQAPNTKQNVQPNKFFKPISFLTRNANNCLAGNYLSSDGSCKPCETGTYQDKDGQISCNFCKKGYMCDETGMITPIPCANNMYTDMNGTGCTSKVDQAYSYKEDSENRRPMIF